MKKIPIVPEINDQVETVSVTSNVSDIKAVLNSSHYLQMVNNDVILTEGVWEVNGYVFGGNNSTAPNWILISALYSYENGTDSATTPSQPPTSELVGPWSQTLGQSTAAPYFTNNSLSLSMAPVYIRVPAGQTRTVYINPFIQAANPTNARVTTTIWAKKIAKTWEIV